MFCFHQSKVGSSMLVFASLATSPERAHKHFVAQQAAAEAAASGHEILYIPASKRHVHVHASGTPEAASASCRKSTAAESQASRTLTASRRRLVIDSHIRCSGARHNYAGALWWPSCNYTKCR